MSWARWKALLFHTRCPIVRPAPPGGMISRFTCELYAHHKGAHIFRAYLWEQNQ